MYMLLDKIAKENASVNCQMKVVGFQYRQPSLAPKQTLYHFLIVAEN